VFKVTNFVFEKIKSALKSIGVFLSFIILNSSSQHSLVPAIGERLRVRIKFWYEKLVSIKSKSPGNKYNFLNQETIYVILNCKKITHRSYGIDGLSFIVLLLTKTLHRRYDAKNFTANFTAK
jgi:hypothetical protein